MKLGGLLLLAAISICIVCGFCIGYGIGEAGGYERGAQETEARYLDLIRKSSAELEDLNSRLEGALVRLQRRLEVETWTALASWYGEESGNITASGRVFDPNELIAAHWHLPFGAVLAVENTGNGRRCFVWVEDRGPAKWTKRTLDLSRAAAEHLGFIEDGVAMVRVWRIL